MLYEVKMCYDAQSFLITIQWESQEEKKILSMLIFIFTNVPLDPLKYKYRKIRSGAFYIKLH